MVLNIDNAILIGEGANRACYQHPLDHKKCIKIPAPNKHRVQDLECRYYKHLESACNDWKHISRYDGETITSRGKGYVYELIRDYDGAISRSLSDYLCLNPAIQIESGVMLRSLIALKNYLIQNKINVRNIRTYNILFKRTDSQNGIAVIVDNIGHHNFLPHVSDYIVPLRRKELEKKWRKFETTLLMETS